jgi:hypothetical protein
MSYTFLSDEWIDAVAKLAADAGGGLMPDSVSLNLVVIGGPHGDRELHIGDGTFTGGLKDTAPTKLTLPYDVAKNMFVKGDQSAAMAAFMSGQIKVEGDMTKLMAMQGGAPDPTQAEVQEKIKEITKLMAMQSSGGPDPAFQQKLREITSDD